MKGGGKKRERERKREKVCVCACMCLSEKLLRACAHAYAHTTCTIQLAEKEFCRDHSTIMAFPGPVPFHYRNKSVNPMTQRAFACTGLTVDRPLDTEILRLKAIELINLWPVLGGQLIRVVSLYFTTSLENGWGFKSICFVNFFSFPHYWI
jgi:hypothetical protein